MFRRFGKTKCYIYSDCLQQGRANATGDAGSQKKESKRQGHSCTIRQNISPAFGQDAMKIMPPDFSMCFGSFSAPVDGWDSQELRRQRGARQDTLPRETSFSCLTVENTVERERAAQTNTLCASTNVQRGGTVRGGAVDLP